MWNYLIKLLGGWTNQEFENSRAALTQLLAAKDVEIKLLRERLESDEKEKGFYREKLFSRVGLNETPQQSPEYLGNKKPELVRGAESWTSRRHRLERADAIRAAEAGKIQVDQTQKHWVEKNKQVDELDNAS
jgi:hypothetical protein